MSVSDKDLKHANLKRVGLLNPQPDHVRDPLFLEQSDFFDPCDQLQVRYEMLRSHMVGGNDVTGICRRFGVSRQTFYSLQEKLAREGTAGLLPKKRGPAGPYKLTEEVLECVREQFVLSLHRRTIERVLRGLRAKKNS
jgi:transposase